MKQYFVYILECSDNSYYTGFTSNLQIRFLSHINGNDEDSYTYSRRPVELKWFEIFQDPRQAIAVEKQIKGWSRRKKKALIEKDWEKLILYSKNYTQFGKNDETSTRMTLNTVTLSLSKG